MYWNLCRPKPKQSDQTTTNEKKKPATAKAFEPRIDVILRRCTLSRSRKSHVKIRFQYDLNERMHTYTCSISNSPTHARVFWFILLIVLFCISFYFFFILLRRNVDIGRKGNIYSKLRVCVFFSSLLFVTHSLCCSIHNFWLLLLLHRTNKTATVLQLPVLKRDAQIPYIVRFRFWYSPENIIHK